MTINRGVNMAARRKTRRARLPVREWNNEIRGLLAKLVKALNHAYCLEDLSILAYETADREGVLALPGDEVGAVLGVSDAIYMPTSIVALTIGLARATPSDWLLKLQEKLVSTPNLLHVILAEAVAGHRDLAREHARLIARILRRKRAKASAVLFELAAKSLEGRREPHTPQRAGNTRLRFVFTAPSRVGPYDVRVDVNPEEYGAILEMASLLPGRRPRVLTYSRQYASNIRFKSREEYEEARRLVEESIRLVEGMNRLACRVAALAVVLLG